MKCLYKKQRGMTALGIFLMLGVLACFVLFGLTAFPLYNEYLSVKTAMNAVINQPPAKRKTVKDIRKIFLRNAEINNISRFDDGTVKKLVNVTKSKDGKKKYINVKYQADNKLFKNVYLMMKVDETMELPGGSSK